MQCICIGYSSFGRKYVQISLEKHQGDYVEVYYKTKEEDIIVFYIGGYHELYSLSRVL